MLVSEVTVVVVLDHVSAGIVRPIDQVFTTPKWHRGSERELMRRRDVNQLGISRGKLVNIETIVINRYRNQLRSVTLENTGGTMVAGILDCDS